MTLAAHLQEERQLVLPSQEGPFQILDVIEAHDETTDHHFSISIPSHMRDVSHRDLLPPLKNELDGLIGTGIVFFVQCCRVAARDGFCSACIDVCCVVESGGDVRRGAAFELIGLWEGIAVEYDSIRNVLCCSLILTGWSHIGCCVEMDEF